MKKILKHIFWSKYTLLLLAVLFFVLAFTFNTIYTNKSVVSRETKLAENYIAAFQKDFNFFCSDTGLIKKLVLEKESLDDLDNITAKQYGIFIYTATETGTVRVAFWSDKMISMPPPDIHARPDGDYFDSLNNGYYVAVKKTLSVEGIQNKLLAYAMIPVRSKFYISTNYLPEKFFYNSTADKRVLLAKEPNDFPVKSLTGTPLFYLDKIPAGSVPYNDRLTIWLRMAALIFLFLFIHILVDAIADHGKPWRAILILLLFLVASRVSTYFFPQILNLRQFELFNPAIYGSSGVQRSLGDLFINSALFCWFVLFAWAKLHHWDITARFSALLKWIAGIFSLGMLIYSTFILASLIRSMVSDSKISFDVTDFFSLNKYTVVGFVVLATLSLSYYYFTQLLFRLMLPLFRGKTILIYFAIGLSGLIYLTVRSGHPSVLFYIPVLLWLIVYTWLIHRRGVIFSRIRVNIAGILLWIFVFSVSIALIMLTGNKKVEWEKRKLLAEKMMEQNDPSSERLLSIALKYLDKDFLSANFPRFRDSDKSKTLRDSIITAAYKGYLNKYDTRIYAYDADEKPLYNDDGLTYDEINTILTVQSRPVDTSNLYFYESAYDKFAYITKRTVMDTAGAVAGSLFIISNPKNYSSDALFPELFKVNRENDPESSPIYSAAVYDSSKLVSSSNKYPFPIYLAPEEIPKEETERRSNGDFDELWYRAGKDNVVVMARKRDTAIESITLFSYIFCSFLFLVSFVQLVSLLLKVINKKKSLRQLWQLNIRSQVHSTIIFISIFSFLIIGASIISFFISRYDRNNNDKLSRTMQIMVNEMQKKIIDHNMFDDMLRVYDTAAGKGLQELVDEVSDIHGVDVNVYDLHGDLYVSSEANVYNRGVLSKKIDPTAYYHLNRLRKSQHSQKEKIGSLSYLSIYAPVRNEDREVEAYLNIPYFTSQPELNQEISNFLVTIINLNAFIFLIAGLIALVVTNRITHSFSLISDKMKEVNLGKMNEEIAWNREDEIGELVKEYNKMVTKLGQSAAALAKSEREGAWREMARQVAHEIKNPLTPMKLSIQYLQKAINNNQPNVKELSANVANTLVEQIDHLSKIAADFSQFANIGNISIERFDLHDVIASLKELYRPNYNVDFIWSPVHREVIVEADKTQMNRLFTNLFTNAVEACNGNSICRIEVNEMQHNGTIRVSVKDNGEGIPADMQARIFVPNFTTKSSGTGLGLAMCKGIVEQAKGKIWFETESGKGSTFHVELPVVS